jgi:endonuclease YncB( thermonuclease family)
VGARLAVLGALLAASLAPVAAHPAEDLTPFAPVAGRTCADYPNQEAAQRAADTRDADGDGIYCETLPCPCAGPGDDAGEDQSRPQPPPRPRAHLIQARITDVVDGDTVKVRAFDARRPRYTVRLLGIDTPETVRPGTPVECGGREAKGSLLDLAFTRPRDSDGDGLLDRKGGQGARVTLTTDPSQDTFDRYDRLLAYVTPRGQTSLQVAQLRAGWAEVYVFEKRFRRYRQFSRAQRSARSAQRAAHGGGCGGHAAATSTGPARRRQPRDRPTAPWPAGGGCQTGAKPEFVA